MNKLLIAVAFTLSASLAVPGIIQAATYAYVDQTGEVRTVEASTAAEAIVTAPNIDENSGALLVNDASDQAIVDESVAVDGNVSASGSFFGVGGATPTATYAYVDQNGEVQTTIASSPMEVIFNTPNIDENSGALLVNDASDQAITDDSVSGV